jgi:hypothetical protein
MNPVEQVKNSKENIMEQPTNEQLLEAAKPLIKLLAENYHPHVKCIVTGANVELLEGLLTAKTHKYIVD